MKFCTSAPFAAALKADILRRWPGGLIEYYGMTEGGGTVVLKAHERPDKLATVGQPAEGHDIRLIDEAGREVGARRDRRDSCGPFAGHDERLPPPAGQDPRSRMVCARRQALHPHRRRRPLRCRRLPDADGPQEGHDHQRRLQRLSQRPRSRADPAPGRGRGGRGRRRLGTLGRDAGGLRHIEEVGRWRYGGRPHRSSATGPTRNSARPSASPPCKSSTPCRAAPSARSSSANCATISLCPRTSDPPERTPMEFSTLEVTLDAGVATIALNRPTRPTP
jgi:hypothetical protein